MQNKYYTLTLDELLRRKNFTWWVGPDKVRVFFYNGDYGELKDGVFKCIVKEF